MAEEKEENGTQEAATTADVQPTSTAAEVADSTTAGETLAHAVAPTVDSQPGNASGTEEAKRGNRAQKVGIVASDKMEKTVVVRVDRLIKHPKYRRYVRRTSKFMAHDETGATVGDKVRIVETRPLSARKRWRVVEIVQKAAK
jgi:small subunit ribosomal protein S17